MLYIYEGGRDYYIKVIAANLRSWIINVEDYATKAGEAFSPVQITYIHYKGEIYPPEPDKGICYTRVEPDEYVEITNLSNSPQDIRGWILKKANMEAPTFTFPPFFQSPYTAETSQSAGITETSIPPESAEYPKPCILEPYQSVRVYTDEFHPESGGFSFNYGSGGLWNNQEPDVAVLYNSQKEEVSRKSYVVPNQE